MRPVPLSCAARLVTAVELVAPCRGLLLMSV
jgi:hypothetical protein